MMLPQKLILDS